MQNDSLLEPIFSKTTIKDEITLLLAVNAFASEQGIDRFVQAAVTIAQGLGKDYNGTAQNIMRIRKSIGHSGRSQQQTASSEAGSGLHGILRNIPETETVNIRFVCTANWNRSPAMEVANCDVQFRKNGNKT